MTMQRINITRTYRKNSYTIGKLYVNGSYVCNTLELHDSTYYGEDFVLGKSAIPVGVYTLATCVWSRQSKATLAKLQKKLSEHDSWKLIIN